MNALQTIAQRFRPVGAAAKNGLIAVHFSQRALHLLQLRRADGANLEQRAYAVAPYVGQRAEFVASPRALKTLVKRTLKTAPFSGRKVISTLPYEHVRLMSVSYPAGPADSEAITISNLMADRVDGELSDYVIDYVPVRTSIRDGERLCMVAVSRREHVVSYLDALSYAGLHVEALEVAPLSVRRLLEHMSQSSNLENILVINTGEETTNLTLISGRRLLAAQTVDFGEQRLLHAICQSLEVTQEVASELLATNGLGVTPGEPAADDLGISHMLQEIVRPVFLDLVDEIDRAFLYAASESYGQAAKRIFLFGALARWQGADRLLDALVQTPVQPMTAELLPFRTQNAAVDTRNTGAADLSVAAGLALWGLATDD